MMLIMMQSPITLIYLSNFSTGNLNDLIAGFGVARIIVTATYISFIFGLNSALETLVSQAKGANDYSLCIVYLNRGRLVLCLQYILFSPICLNTAYFLKLLGQPPVASDIAQEYVHVFMPGIFMFALSDCQRRFLNCLGLSRVPFYTIIFSNVCHIALCHLLIKEWDWGIRGVAWSNNIVNALQFLIMYVYQQFIPELKNITICFDFRTCEDIWDYL